MWQIQWVALGLLVMASGCGSPNNKNATFSPRQKGPKMPSDSSQVAEAISPSILPGTFVAAGRLHESEGHLARAAEQYRMAIATQPDNIEAYNRLGIVLDQLGKFKEADQCLMRATQLAPGKAHLHNNLAFSYIMQGRWSDAQGELGKALEIDPNFTRARVNMGTVLAQQGKFDEAFRSFHQVLRAEDAYYNIGLMYQSKQRPVDAARAFKQAIAANPKMIAAKKRLDLLPPDVLSEAEDPSAIFAFTAALTGQTASPAPATQPSVSITVQPTVDRPVPTTQPDPESIQQIVTKDATEAVVDATPSPSTQPADIENAAPSEPSMPMAERTSTEADIAEIRIEPATQSAAVEATIEVTVSNDSPAAQTQPAMIEVTVPAAEPVPNTQPAPEATEPSNEPIMIEEASEADVDAMAEYPPAATGFLAMLAHPADLICMSIEPVEMLMSWISPAAVDAADAIASPLPAEVVEPQAGETGSEEITVSPNP
jgi:Flp pilus assembly protein TadD